MSNFHDSKLYINDILLSIPPTDIHITKDSINNQWQTLRTTNSQKTKSGYSTVTIEFTVPFINADVQNKLQPLIAELRYFPFAFIENQFIRENLFPKETESGLDDIDIATMVVAMRSINIMIDNEEEDIIWATFQFAYFNYLPYIPFWQYKLELFGDDAQKTTPFPHLSNAWKDFVKAPIADGQSFGNIDGDATIKFLELATGPVASIDELQQSKEILQNISSNQQSFFDNLRKNPSNTLDKTFNDALHNTFSQYANVDAANSLDLMEKLLLNSSPKSNPNSNLYRNDKQYIDQNELKTVLSKLDQRILARQKFDNQNKNNDSRAFQPIPELQSQDNRGKGFGVFKRERELKLSTENDSIISIITISIQNILATIPIAGHRYATFQHIGSIDATVTLDIKCMSDEAVRNISWFYDTVNENMTANRHIPQGLQTIKVVNSFLSLFNLREFITQDIHVDTIKGLPGTYDVKLSLIESGLKQKDKIGTPSDSFQIEFANSDEKVIKEIVRILNQYTIVKQNNSFAYFDSGVLDSKSARFAEIVKNYIGHQTVDVTDPLSGAVVGETPDDKALSDFADQIFRKILQTNGALYETLFALTEDDIPGISKVQELISAQVKNTKGNIPQSITNLNNKPYSQLLSDARNNVVKNNGLTALQQTKALYEKLNFGPGGAASISVPEPVADPLSGFIVGESGGDIPDPKLAEFQTKTDTSTINLLTNKIFTNWTNFISSFAQDILDSDDIDLPELASAKKMVQDIGLGRGLPAYDDFHLERILNGTNLAGNVDAILSLDPDCFLYTPMDTNVDDYVDPALIANAKNIAKTSFDSALDQISKFYQWSWLPNFLTDNVRQTIQSNIKASVFQNGTDNSVALEHGGDPLAVYYQDNIKIGKFQNAAAQNAVSSNPIQIGGPSLFDSPQKSHATISEATLLKSYKGITHSLDPNDLFGKDNLGSAALDPLNPAGKIKSNKQKKSNKLGNPLTNAKAPEGGYIPIEPAVLASQAGVDLDTYSLARMIASEEGNNTQPYLSAVGWSAVNQARGLGISVSHLLLRAKTGNGYYGAQNTGRYASTRTDPYQIHIDTANGIINGTISDLTGGATHWFSPRVQDDPKVRARVQGQTKSSQEVVDSWTNGPRGNLEIVSVPGIDSNHLTLFKPKGKVASRYIPPAQNNTRNTAPIISPASINKNNNSTNLFNPDTGLGANINVLDMCIDQFKKSLQTGQANRLVRAFPAFKLYFIQDDSGNRRRYGADDFFSYNAVSEIKCVRSRKIPADLMEVTLTNVSGTLSNRKFQNPIDPNSAGNIDASDKPLDPNGNIVKQDPNGFLKRDTKNENPIASLLLQAGMDIELMLGYANDPKKLTTVFVGKIMEVEFSDSDDLVKIICQSHAIELVQDIKGTTEPIVKDGLFKNDARTDRLLESLLAEPEVIHFGRYVRSKSYQSDTNTNRFLLTNRFTLQPQPQDDNIFVPSLDQLKQLDPGWVLNKLQYNIYHTTIWDVFEEMTLRHPGWIKSAVPYQSKYGPRMTMFFGLPSQLYFAADPSSDEKSASSKLKKSVDAYNNDINDLKAGIDKLRTASTIKSVDNSIKSVFGQPGNNSKLDLSQIGGLPDIAFSIPKRDFAAERLALARDYQSIKPFRSYHLLTSKHHIVSNNIRASAKNTYNTISIQYGKSSWNKDTEQLIQEGTDVLTLSVDAALPDEEVRELFASYKNCQTELMARHYACAALIRELKDVYRGELTIIGNPDIKPHDICYIFDDYNDITGPVEVEQVIHYFSQDTGFITEITPDLFVTANEWVNMTGADMMSIVMEGVASKLNHSTPTITEELAQGINPIKGVLGAYLSPLSFISEGITKTGSYLFNKIVDFTSHGSPVVIHPLMYHGKPFIAGLPIAKLNNLWLTDKGQWIKQGVNGFELLLDDFNDKITFAASQGSALNLFSGSTIPPKF